MKIFFHFAILFLIMNITAFAQSLSFELDKIREIKMLGSTRDNVKRTLAGYKLKDDEDDESNSQTFSSGKMEIEISYTTGDCSDEADETDEWNVAKGKVKLIEITFTDSVTLEDLQIDLSDFKKEQYYANVEDKFAYYTTDLEITIHVEKEEIEKIVIMPALKKSSLLCKNEENEEVEKLRKAYSNKSIFLVLKLEDRVLRTDHFQVKVADLILSATEITASCSAVEPRQNKECSNSPRILNVSASSNMPEDEDWLVFIYTVSGGRIVGEGKDVMWDLSDVKPGTYTITAKVDDGCGVCGETKTKTVEVK
jgi:hypothetical protein